MTIFGLTRGALHARHGAQTVNSLVNYARSFQRFRNEIQAQLASPGQVNNDRITDTRIALQELYTIASQDGFGSAVRGALEAVIAPLNSGTLQGEHALLNGVLTFDQLPDITAGR
jgi:hypothetical protein